MTIRLTILAVSLVFAIGAETATAVPQLGVDPAGSLYFSPCEDIRVMYIYNAGDGVLEWSTWVSDDYVTVNPPSGSNEPGWENRTAVSVHVDRTGLAGGRYLVNMYISGNFPRVLKFVDILQREGPNLHAIPTHMYLSLSAPSDVLRIGNTGADPLEWAVTLNVPWLQVTPVTSGVVPCASATEVTVTLLPDELPSLDESHSGRALIETNDVDQPVVVDFMPPNASPGTMGIYMDVAGTNCNIVYQSAGLLTVYVVHRDFDNAAAAQFSAPKPDCWAGATYLSDTDIFPVTIGNSQTGKSVGYGSCRTPPVHVTSINYFVQITEGPACCPYPVLPDPQSPSGEIDIVDCTNSTVYATGLVARIKPDGSCPCGTVPTEETTWGRVKAMYSPDGNSRNR